MCLYRVQRASKRDDEFLDDKERIGYAVATKRTYTGGYTGVFYHERTFRVGREHDARNRRRRLTSISPLKGNKYYPGFHIFRTLAGARRFQREIGDTCVILKVRYRGLLAVGKQRAYRNDITHVARWRTIIGEVE